MNSAGNNGPNNFLWQYFHGHKSRKFFGQSVRNFSKPQTPTTVAGKLFRCATYIRHAFRRTCCPLHLWHFQLQLLLTCNIIILCRKTWWCNNSCRRRNEYVWSSETRRLAIYRNGCQIHWHGHPEKTEDVRCSSPIVIPYFRV